MDGIVASPAILLASLIPIPPHRARVCLVGTEQDVSDSATRAESAREKERENLIANRNCRCIIESEILFVYVSCALGRWACGSVGVLQLMLPWKKLSRL